MRPFLAIFKMLSFFEYKLFFWAVQKNVFKRSWYLRDETLVIENGYKMVDFGILQGLAVEFP